MDGQSLMEGVVIPWPGSRMAPKVVANWWVMAAGAASSTLALALQLIQPGLFEDQAK